MVNLAEGKSAAVDDCCYYSNTLSRWVAGEIVQTGNIKKRVAVIRRYIEIAEECWKLHNFSSAASILFGVDNHAVKRLKQTWKGLPKRSVKVFSDLLETITVANGFERFREVILKAEPPLVPYLPIYLRDITLLELGNSTYLEGNECF